jgi:Spy/CpxP family protein refolding chaperone
MKTKLLTQIIITLVVLFGLGGLCGYAMSARIHSGRPAWTQSQQWAERWLEQRMAQDFARIDATPEQQAKLKPSYDRLLSDFNAIQAEASAKVAEAFKRHGLDMWKQLTPEQREIIRQTNQERVSRRAANSNPPAK